MLRPPPGGEPGARAELLRVDPASAVTDAGGWTALAWPATGAEPHGLVALRLPYGVASGEPYLREGWQSWSTPAPARVGDGVRRVRAEGPPRCGRRHWLADPPYAGDESYHVWRSASVTAYVEQRPAVFVAERGELCAVREEPADGSHPAVWCTPRRVSDAELAARLAIERRPVPAHVGWSSWDAYGAHVTGQDLLGELAAIERRLGDTVEVVNVDDGWQRLTGDWVPGDATMAHALARIADHRRLSLWWAPFVLHRESALAAAHPDWVLRGRDGSPMVVLARDEPWEAWALDLSHADVLGWLESTAVRLAGYGARLFKCDFLYASAFTGDAARAGTCADPSVTGEEAHRRALGAIRASGVRVIGCGAPLWASVGLVDFMRVGPDTGRCWWQTPPAELEPVHAGGCLANAWAAAHRRAWMDGALWRNDPDSVRLGGGPRFAAWLEWVAGQGLPMVLGEAVRALTPEQRERWERAVGVQRRARARGDRARA